MFAVDMVVDPETHCGTTVDGIYAVCMRGEAFGAAFDISVNGKPRLSIWARHVRHMPLPLEHDELGTATSVEEWIVDNGAGTGLPELLTLSERIGDRTLGDILRAFLIGHRQAKGAADPASDSVLKLSCRGNQKALMQDIAGR